MTAQLDIEHQSASWLAADVNYHLAALIRAGHRFTSEDLRQRLSPANHVLLKSRTGTIGRSLQGASKAGLIVAVGYETAKHEQANGHVVRIWEPVKR